MAIAPALHTEHPSFSHWKVWEKTVAAGWPKTSQPLRQCCHKCCLLLYSDVSASAPLISCNVREQQSGRRRAEENGWRRSSPPLSSPSHIIFCFIHLFQSEKWEASSSGCDWIGTLLISCLRQQPQLVSLTDWLCMSKTHEGHCH